MENLILSCENISRKYLKNWYHFIIFDDVQPFPLKQEIKSPSELNFGQRLGLIYPHLSHLSRVAGKVLIEYAKAQAYASTVDRVVQIAMCLQL